MKNKSYIITGPTASGKSEFAHNLAKRVNGVIINCDSVQMYKGIEVMSASPFAGTQITDTIGGIDYRLFSMISLEEQISVVDYLKLATDEYNKIIQSGKIAIFVGGTGYYIDVLLNGISPVPQVSEKSRNKARKQVAESIENAREILGDNFKFQDPQRTSRALEVFYETGKHLSDWQALPKQGAITPKPFKVLISPDRDLLRQRIANRIPEMLLNGAIDEAQNIINAGWDASRAIGASQLIKFLNQEITKSQAIENWITKTNQYAKRQRTWAKNQYGADYEILNIPTNKDLEELLKK